MFRSGFRFLFWTCRFFLPTLPPLSGTPPLECLFPRFSLYKHQHSPSFFFLVNGSRNKSNKLTWVSDFAPPPSKTLVLLCLPAEQVSRREFPQEFRVFFETPSLLVRLMGIYLLIEPLCAGSFYKEMAGLFTITLMNLHPLFGLLFKSRECLPLSISFPLKVYFFRGTFRGLFCPFPTLFFFFFYRFFAYRRQDAVSFDASFFLRADHSTYSPFSTLLDTIQ